ncbi:MAG: hypothetical protein FWG97_00165 [Deltaproteobacteria bacterium]|nr:hypothetical protein [Deltaproteobacteria bacterium]
MENLSNSLKGTNLAADIPQKKIASSLVALMLGTVPALLFLGASFSGGLFSILVIFGFMFFPFSLILVLSPFVGVIIGIKCLCQEKDKIGTAGYVISIMAIALPIVLVATIISRSNQGAYVIGM